MPYFDVFIVCDDHAADFSEFRTRYPSMQFVQIDEKQCIDAKFTDVNFTIPKPITSWEKSLYLMCKDKTVYDSVWFCEDDVFIPSIQTLTNLDKNFPNADLLCSGPITTHTEEKPTDWHWPLVKWDLPLPWLTAMMCIVRMSRSMLKALENHVQKYNKIYFLEASFPTIAEHASLKIESPPEMHSVVYRYDWKPPFSIDNLYHPIKDIDSHAGLRETLQTTPGVAIFAEHELDTTRTGES